MTKKPKTVRVGDTSVTPISPEENRKLDERIKKRHEALRRRYPEVHGKVVDFINNSIEDGTIYISVRFTDKTEFSLRYAGKLFLAGADLSDAKTFDFDIIREYMKPIPR